MLTWRYSKSHPEGKLFDTEGRQHPYPPPELNGWFDCRSKINITQDELIEAVVKLELAKQDSKRPELEREVLKKHGERISTIIPDKSAVKALDAPVVKRKPGRPRKAI